MKNFFDCKDEKITEKAFSQGLLISVLSIFLCIMVFCSTTYAWFTGSVPSDNNKIQAADACLLSVSVYKDGAEEAKIDTENATTLECKGTYTVTLTLPKESASGYLVLSVDSQEYYSDYLQRNDYSDGALTFTLSVKTAKSVTFTARWGIYSGECRVKNGESLIII